jgi:hypothetical protein
MQIYWERAGEENRQENWRLPYKYADIYGLYLPSLMGFERIDLRAEYSENKLNKQAYVWYTHGTYTAGYTYQGMIMGHHMGTESRDLFLELACLVPEKNARISLSYDQETHDLAGPVSEMVREWSLSGRSLVSQQIEVSASLGYGSIKNPENEVGPTARIYEFDMVIRYVF